jgi:hypothetical protein
MMHHESLALLSYGNNYGLVGEQIRTLECYFKSKLYKIVEPYVLLELMESGCLKKTFNPQCFKTLFD